MLVKILNFGCNWWRRHGSDPEDSFRYTRRAVFYNSTGVQCGSKPGQLCSWPKKTEQIEPVKHAIRKRQPRH